MRFDFIFGCRAPNSLRYDNAFVALCDRDSKVIKCTLFQNGMDYVSPPMTIKKCLSDFDKCLQEGWLPMDLTDLISTANCKDEIDERTITDWRLVLAQHESRRMIMYILITLSFVFVFSFALSFLKTT